MPASTPFCHLKIFFMEWIADYFVFSGVFDDFSFLTKDSIEVISVGMERSNGISMEIFCLRNLLQVSSIPNGQMHVCIT